MDLVFNPILDSDWVFDVFKLWFDHKSIFIFESLVLLYYVNILGEYWIFDKKYDSLINLLKISLL